MEAEIAEWIEQCFVSGSKSPQKLASPAPRRRQNKMPRLTEADAQLILDDFLREAKRSLGEGIDDNRFIRQMLVLIVKSMR